MKNRITEKKKLDKEADLFARKLLMPEEFFIIEHIICNGDLITLSKIFDVEKKHIKNRIKDLDL